MITMDPTFIIYGALSALVLLLSWSAWRFSPARYADAAGLAMMLWVTWAISNVLVLGWGLPDAMRAYPVLDLICGTVAALAWGKRPAAWKAVLAFTYLTECCAHVAFWVWWGGRAEALYSYATLLNVLFLVQLGSVSVPGVGCVAGRIGDWLSARPRGGHLSVRR